MIEGLWVVRFLAPANPEMDLNGGVVVIESGKIFGGDSGYFYVGSLQPIDSGVWSSEVTINRHDPDIISIFGDTDVIHLSGQFKRDGEDGRGRPKLLAELAPHGSDVGTTIELIHVANLP